MRILVCTLEGEGAWYVWLLQHEGHTVDWVISKPDVEPRMQGIIAPPKSKVNAKDYDLVLFTSTDMGEDADEASLSVPVIGDSVLADKLEDDRLFGIEAMEKCGIKVPAWEAFDSPSKAIAWLRKTHKRAVLKPFGDVPKDLTYVAKSEADMIAFIEQRLPGSGVKQFILQEFVQGTEVSAEGWFHPSLKGPVAVGYTLEEKKLMAGGLGPNTGCSGNAYWLEPRPTPLFEQGLGKCSPFLADASYVGPLDLNMIVTPGAVYGLEWTPRFGYEGTCNLTRLLPCPFADFLHGVAVGEPPDHMVSRARFAATLRMGVPPYPNKVKAKWQVPHVPIKGLAEEDFCEFFVFDINKEDDQLIVCGEGNVGTPIGCSETIAGAFDEVMHAINRLEIPDVMYRVDAAKCVQKRYDTLQQQGWLKLIG